MQDSSFAETIQHNCDISDARDNGIYSICTLVLKLRNLYKWENHIAPWDEPEPQEILDWIASREEYWATIEKNSFLPLPVDGHSIDPFQIAAVNTYLHAPGLVYGAGYGRSMKSIFFLAELVEKKTVEGCPVMILDKEIAKELNIAVHTVKSHVHNVLDKLALHTRLEVASFALSEGMIRKSQG